MKTSFCQFLETGFLLIFANNSKKSFIGYTLTELFRKPDNSRQIYKQTNSTFYTSNMCLKRVEKKKLLRRHDKDIYLKTFAR